ncbi:MAG: aroK [Gemmatimonadetes bacterium]|nr:aroK [Gemmatimonadota bacterium]
MPTFRTSQPGSAADPARPHFVLVGLPGSGKSTVGMLLGQQLNRQFLDFDVEIARREGMTIAEIFAQRGEPAFREMERKLTRECAELGSMVLAPGGGWVTQPDVVALLRPPAVVIYLRVTAATALKRMGASATGRPLLVRPNPSGELGRLLETRRSAYETADLVVDVERLVAQEVAYYIASRLPPV